MSEYSGVAGKRILITGATSGLGFAMARALLKADARVAIAGRNQEKIDEAAASVASLGGEAMGLTMDVRDEASICAGLARMVEQWSGIDILINNAGIGMRTVNPQFLTKPAGFWEVSSEKFRDLIDTNLTGYFLVAKHTVPYFLKQGGGRIINVTMNHETMRRKGFVPYGPSRAATESLSHIMAQDLSDHHVTVNMLLPGGGTDTGMIPDGFQLPAGMALLQPDVMAEPTLFLCSDEAAGVNDQRIVAKDWVRGG